MPRRPSTFTFALCASLTAHAGLMALTAWWFVRSSSAPRFAALPRSEPQRAPILAPAAPPPPPAQPPPPPPPPPPPHPPKENFDQATHLPVRDDSGEANSHGTANRSTPGQRPMQAHQGLEQANLARNEHPDEVSKLDDSPLAAQSGIKTPSDAAPAPPPAFGVAEPTPQPRDPNAGRQKMIAVADASQAAPPLPLGNSPQPANTLGSPTGKPNQPPTAQQPEAEPMEIQGHASLSSDTDSEAFAHANSAEFHDGRLTARQGRRVRTTRIEFGLAASADALAVADPTVVLGVRVDAAGYVQNVVLLHSSGSSNIDLPCQRSVYNWWFEPKKDKDGRGLPDLWVVTID